jgi:predicted flap endonuclease-1-like 5' DNA nuclease
MEFIRENWLLVVIAVAVVAILAFLLLRPRQRVQLSQSGTPVRPHMRAKADHVGRGLTDEAAAAVSDVSGEIISAPVHDNLPGGSGPPDDLTRLKGVGPKFAALLNGAGITRFDQLARLTDGDIDRLDKSLGAFSGRLGRDQVPLQADYLARGDQDGFEQRFGKL